MTTDSYADAVAALRDTIKEYEGETEQEVAAKAADCFLEYYPEFIGPVDDPQIIAKTLFLVATVLVTVRDSTEEDVDHLLEVEQGVCEDEGCELSHDELNSDAVNGLLDGLNAGIAAAVGMALAMADLATPADFDEMEWNAPGE